MGKVNSYEGSASFNRSRHEDRAREREREEYNRMREREREAEENRAKPQQHAYEVDEHPFELRHEVKRLNTRLDKIADSLEKADFRDIIENYMNPKKRLLTNFTAGLSRGLGMTVGTVLVLSLLGYILSLFVNMPLIGDYIAELQKYVNQSR